MLNNLKWLLKIGWRRGVSYYGSTGQLYCQDWINKTTGEVRQVYYV